MADTDARDAYLNLVRLHERLSGEFAALFREHDLTPARYNVLRILLGGPEEGAPCRYIGERLLNRLPDVTRLLDRMVDAGLVTRARSKEDRRVVLVRVTPKGRRRCERLARPVDDLHRKQFAHLSRSALRDLNARLREALERE